MSQKSRYIYRGPLPEVEVAGVTVAQGEAVELDDETLQPFHAAGHRFDFVAAPADDAAPEAAGKAKARAKPKD